MRQDGPIRVLIIDDHPLFRRALTEGLNRHPDIHACACGSDTVAIREHLLRDHPEVIVASADLHHAGVLPLVRRLRANYPVPLLIYSEHTGPDDRIAKALELGATETLVIQPDPRPRNVLPAASRLVARIRAVASGVPLPPAASTCGPRVGLFRTAGVDPAAHIVAVGASTGGTQALPLLLSRVPPDFPPTVIVQHMPAGFTRAFANRLDTLSAARVSEATDGEPLRPGCVFIARGDTHLTVRVAGNGWVARYTHREPVNRHCPSVDVLFESVARAAGRQAIGILMTGMGNDGAQGLLTLRRAGAVTIAQDEQSCIVYGMPKEAVDRGAAMYTAPPEEMPALILRALQERTRHPRSAPVRPK